ncbi:hypothetical protein B0H67DRAFT_148472 [Lasiosphaeris hirsuta]|uniref:Uncharacterized protein n=1 Tax=Lasiosphaeris hirsuta TaxID=260670 RepID=A0AA40ANM9_9PEZI|nr:hypothetical protein B0H67DRAFT_148472 [Lasiosphaeris hirsuta]
MASRQTICPSRRKHLQSSAWAAYPANKQDLARPCIKNCGRSPSGLARAALEILHPCGGPVVGQSLRRTASWRAEPFCGGTKPAEKSALARIQIRDFDLSSLPFSVSLFLSRKTSENRRAATNDHPSVPLFMPYSPFVPPFVPLLLVRRNPSATSKQSARLVGRVRSATTGSTQRIPTKPGLFAEPPPSSHSQQALLEALPQAPFRAPITHRPRPLIGHSLRSTAVAHSTGATALGSKQARLLVRADVVIIIALTCFPGRALPGSKIRCG